MVQSCQQLNAEGKTKQKALWHHQNSAAKLRQTPGSGETSPGKHGFMVSTSRRERTQAVSLKRQKGGSRSSDVIEQDSTSDLLQHASVQIIASAHYMLSELFQLEEPSQEDGEESLRAGGSEDSYSDDDREEEEDEEAELTDDSDERASYRTQDDSKAVAIIRSVGELSVPEKYKSTHQIRVSLYWLVDLFNIRMSQSEDEAS